MSIITSFSMPQVVIYLSTGLGDTNLNYPLNQTTIRLYKNVLNTIEVYIKDVDRKPVTFATGITPIIKIFDQKKGELITQKSLNLVDATKSLWSFTIVSSDIEDWSVVNLNYSILLIDSNNTQSLLYTDRTYSPVGIVTVFDGPIPTSPQPIEIFSADFLYEMNDLYTSSYPGAATVRNLTGQHTAVAYMTNFIGTIEVQGSLDLEAPNTNDQWATIDVIQFDGSLPISSFTFFGNLLWVRFKISPQLNTTGTVDRILFQN